MSTPSKAKTRVTGIKSGYKHWNLLQEHLNQDQHNLYYFSFAKIASKSKVTTNLIYKDLLMKLLINQSVKVMAIAQKANSDFKQRDTLQQSQFKQEYQEYWQKREDTDAESQINSNTLKTVVNLSQMTTTSVMDKAAELHHIEASQNKDDGISPVDDCDSRNDNSSINEDTSDNSFTEELYSIVEKSNEFASDHIGGVLRWVK